MSEDVLLVGASGLAREVLAAGMPGVVGILDDNAELHGTDVAGVPVVGGVDDAASRTEHLLVCVGPSFGRRSVVSRLASLGVTDDRYTSYAAPSVRVGASSSVGVGSILLDGVVITADAWIGRHVVIMPNCTITHDDQLLDFVTVAAGSALGGGVRVGEGAYLGMGCSIRQGLHVGPHATIGMGSVVLTDVPAKQTWAGIPARQLGVST